MKSVSELKKFAEAGMEFAIAYLKEHGSLTVMFHLLRADGNHEIVAVPGALVNSKRARQVFSDAIRRKVASGGYEAVLIISDTYTGTTDNEEDRDEIVRRDLNVEEAAAAGLCTMRQALAVCLDSPLYAEYRMQFYRRDEEAQRIDLEESDVIVGDESGSGISGRMARFFPEAARA